jgi:autonomous glycyl radical cofactor GrcA
MDRTDKIRKIGGDKIALLGLFIVSLLAARIIVVSRSAILLSEPITLSRSGLSVSMPEGNGWKSEKRWRHFENGSSLRSRFALGTRNPTAQARCVYIPAADTTNLRRLFEQKALEIEGKIVKTDQIRKGTLTFDWVQIENPKTSRIIIFGTAKLLENQRLDIEVQQIMNDPWMAEKAFKKIINNLNYEGNQLVETSNRIITQLEDRKIKIYFDNQKQLYKRLAQKENTYILKSTTLDDVVKKFPKWTEYIQ